MCRHVIGIAGALVRTDPCILNALVILSRPMPSHNSLGDLHEEHVFDVPLREVSGICLRRGPNRRMSLIAVGDRAANRVQPGVYRHLSPSLKTPPQASPCGRDPAGPNSISAAGSLLCHQKVTAGQQSDTFAARPFRMRPRFREIVVSFHDQLHTSDGFRRFEIEQLDPRR